MINTNHERNMSMSMPSLPIFSGLSTYFDFILKATHTSIHVLQRHLSKTNFVLPEWCYLELSYIIRVHMDYGMKLALILLHTQHPHNNVQQQIICKKLSKNKQQWYGYSWSPRAWWLSQPLLASFNYFDRLAILARVTSANPLHSTHVNGQLPIPWTSLAHRWGTNPPTLAFGTLPSIGNQWLDVDFYP